MGRKAKKLGGNTYKNSDITALINEYIHSKRDREILIDWFVDGSTSEQIAEKHELTNEQVRNIIVKADDLLLKFL